MTDDKESPAYFTAPIIEPLHKNDDERNEWKATTSPLAVMTVGSDLVLVLRQESLKRKPPAESVALNRYEYIVSAADGDWNHITDLLRWKGDADVDKLAAMLGLIPVAERLFPNHLLRPIAGEG